MSKLYPKLKFLLVSMGIALLLTGLGTGFLVKHTPWRHQLPSTAVASNLLSHGSYYEVSIPPEKTDSYLSADYRLWVPQDVRKIRGLIVRQHGCGDEAAGTGLDHANDLQWQALAAKHRFALLGTKLPTGNKPCESWALINYGSKKAFLKALHALAKKSQRPELEEIPWVLWGHSGGADWAVQMMQEYPAITIALIATRGGGFQLFGSNPSLIGIPVLFMLGKNDPYASETIDLPQQAFSRYRRIKAPWAIAIDPKAAHETGNSRFLAIPYLDAIINQRLPGLGNQLYPIKVSEGWLGDMDTYAIAPIKQYKEDLMKAAWVPDEKVARKWQEYVTKGEISSTQKPVAPVEVRAVKNTKAEAVITWKYQPDLENGLPSFRIYRGKSLVATLQGQDHNFGDAPEPSNVVLEFVDKDAQSDSTYTVAAFNVLGESASASTSLKEKGKS